MLASRSDADTWLALKLREMSCSWHKQVLKNADSRKNFFTKKRAGLRRCSRRRRTADLIRLSLLSPSTGKRAKATKQMIGWIAAGAVEVMQLVGGYLRRRA